MNPLLLLLLLLRDTVSDSIPYQTAISSKRGFHHLEPIAIGVQSYKELVKTSKTFVDTSLFIEQALNYTCKSLLLLGPPKWGKTMNLDMLKTFLEIQVDDRGNEILPKQATSNYKLFVDGKIVSDYDDMETVELEKPLLISTRKNLLEFYQGNFPVVYVSFKHVNGSLYSTVKKNLLRTIRNAFLDHKYMINVLQNVSVNGDYAAQKSARRELKFFQNVLQDEKLDKDSMCRSIRFLCETLQNHFNREAFVIFDDYDEPIINMMRSANLSSNKIEQVFLLLDLLNDMTFNHNPHLHLGISTGIFQMHPSSFVKWNTYALEEIPYKTSPITQFFGISEQDLGQLFEIHRIPPQLQEKVYKWLVGHTTAESDARFYSPFLVANMLNRRKIPHPLPSTNYDRFASELCKFNGEARDQILSFLNGQPARVELVHRKITDTHVMSLIKKDIEGEDNFYPWYLFRAGYLSVHSLVPPEQIYQYKYAPPDNVGVGFFAHYVPPVDEIMVHMPNTLVALRMSAWMMSYYKHRYGIAENLVEDSALLLLDYVDNKSWDVTVMERSFERVYNQSNYFTVSQNDVNSETEDLAREIFTCIVMKMQSISLFRIDVYYDRFMSTDIVIVNNGTREGFLTQFLCSDEKTQKTTRSIEQYVSEVFQRLPHVGFVKLIAVHMASNKTIRMAVTVEERPGL